MDATRVVKRMGVLKVFPPRIATARKVKESSVDTLKKPNKKAQDYSRGVSHH
jgi:hypothetical protein